VDEQANVKASVLDQLKRDSQSNGLLGILEG